MDDDIASDYFEVLPPAEPPTQRASELAAVSPVPSLPELYASIAASATRCLLLEPTLPIFCTSPPRSCAEALPAGLLAAGVTPERVSALGRCKRCADFLTRYADLAVFDSKAQKLVPLLWSDVGHPTLGRAALSPLARAVEEAAIARVWTAPGSLVGVPSEGGFEHMSFSVGAARAGRPGSADAGTQVQMLGRVLQDNSVAHAKRAKELLEGDRLHDAQRHRGAIDFLVRVHAELGRLARDDGDGKDSSVEARRTRRRDNLLWYMVAGEAAVGWVSSLRTGALSTLLESVRADQPFDELDRAWSAVTDPTRYLRPSALPTEGNVEHANRLFAATGIEQAALRRFYLRPAEIPEAAYRFKCSTLRYPPSIERTPGVFSGVDTKQKKRQKENKSMGDQAAAMPASKISLAKFVRDVLPDARNVWYLVPRRVTFYVLICGAPGTPALMQWHTPGNLASWFTFPEPVSPSTYSVAAGDWVPVHSACLFPDQWPRDGDGADEKSNNAAPSRHTQVGQLLLVLQGARFAGKAGSCLFPAFLRSEFHGCRATIERFSQQNEVVKRDDDGAFQQVTGPALVTRRGDIVGGPFSVRVAAHDRTVREYVISVGE